MSLDAHRNTASITAPCSSSLFACVCSCCHPTIVHSTGVHPTCSRFCATVVIQLVFIQFVFIQLTFACHCCHPTCDHSTRVHPTCSRLCAIVVIQFVFIQPVFIQVVHVCEPLLSSNLCSFNSCLSNLFTLVCNCCHPTFVHPAHVHPAWNSRWQKSSCSLSVSKMYLSSQVFSNTSRAPARCYIHHQQCYDCD